MEQDVLRRLAGKSKSMCSSIGDDCKNIKQRGSGVAKAACTLNWWSQLKTAGAAIYANRHYLALRQQRQRVLQQQSSLDLPSPVKYRSTTLNPVGYSTIGHVYVHPTAFVHSTALVSYHYFLNKLSQPACYSCFSLLFNIVIHYRYYYS